VFRKAKEIGCKVMLDGQGADEILLGYKRYYSAMLRALPRRNMIREMFFIKANSTLSLRELFKYLLYFSVPRIRIARLRRKFAYIKTKYLLHFPNIWQLNQACRNIQSMQKLEIEGLQLPHLLRYEDRNSMCHSIEARLPFLDYRLVEAAFSMNDHFKIRHGWAKHALRIAMDGLVPKSILWRKDKLGFESPQADWINAVRESMVAAIRKSAIVGSLCKGMPDLDRIDDTTFWKLYSIAKWEEIYAVRPAPSVEAPNAASARDAACTVRPV
jgi:asparagine synthase (glutamine-hydrolysing)